MTDHRFDGVTYPYIPEAEQAADLAASLHTQHQDAADAAEYEILRHALWNLNIEHGQTIIRTSGSPVVVNAHDFNPVLMDESGGHVYFGPWLQYLAAGANTVVEWVMDYRRKSPGIEPGSMFMTNDPWIGAVHQSDLIVVAPVFVDGKIFAWVGNSLHHADLGGTSPGGFNPVAPDIFHESGVVPPLRFVENGELRMDIVDEFTRRSRFPEMVAVDLRGQVAGCAAGVRALEKLVARYGAATVKGVMRKIQSDAETSFERRLATVPDGEWRAEAYLEASEPGDRNLYRNRLTLRKEGGRLTFTNEGTHEQTPGLSCTLGGFRGGVCAMINSQLVFDQGFAIGGAMRRLDFEVDHSTLTSALYPTPMSLAVLTIDQIISLAANVLSKMLSCSTDPELHKEVQSTMGQPVFPVAAFSGVANGRPYAAFFSDNIGPGAAAWSDKDGIDVGGWPWDPLVQMPNVEDTESLYPFLYLWRRVTPDSGGAGEHRGGNSMDIAVLPRGVDEVAHHMASSANHVLPQSAVFGGLPSNVNSFQMARDTEVESVFGEGRIPRSLADIRATSVEEISQKAFGVTQSGQDVFLFGWCGGGGLGDPLDRDPERVRRDVFERMVSAEAAHELYGVVLEDGAVDQAATEARRRTMRDRRQEWRGGADLGRAEPTGQVRPVGPGLEIRAHGGGEVLACGRCNAVLAERAGNWKSGARHQDTTVQAVSPAALPAARLSDIEVSVRQYCCPGCLRLLDTEVLTDGGDGLWDIQLAKEAR